MDTLCLAMRPLRSRIVPPRHRRAPALPGLLEATEPRVVGSLVVEMDHCALFGLAVEEGVVPPDVFVDRAGLQDFGAAVDLQAAEAADLGAVLEVEDVEDEGAAA